MKQYWFGIIIVISCYWATWSCGQSITWGPTYERSSLFNQQEVARIGTDKMLVWQHYKDPQYYWNYKALQYDKLFNQTASPAPITFEYQGIRGTYQANHYQNNQWRFYYTIPSTATTKEVLCWATLNTQTLALETNAQIIDTLPYNAKLGKASYQLGKAPNKQTLLYGLLPQVRKQAAQLVVYQLDEAGKVVLQQQIPAPQEAGLFRLEDIQDAILTPQGNAYLLCKFYHKKSRKEEKKTALPYHYALLQIDAQGATIWRDSLNISAQVDSSELVSARLYSHPNLEQVRCIGTYRRPSSAGMFQLNLVNESLWAMAYPDALNRVPIERKSKKVGLHSYKIQQGFPQDDGSFLAIAEQQYTKVYWDKSEGGQTLQRLQDILLMKWDAQGKLLWYHNIPKRQRAGGEGYTAMQETWHSFNAFEQNQKIHLFYNDLPQNKNAAAESLETGYYNQPQALQCWHYCLHTQTGELINAQTLDSPKDWLIYPKKIQLRSDGQIVLAALQLAASAKEKAKIRWGHCTLEKTE
ncbi:MAG: hypothetical protein AB8E82_12130 [Aureispira sp.]